MQNFAKYKLSIGAVLLTGFYRIIIYALKVHFWIIPIILSLFSSLI